MKFWIRKKEVMTFDQNLHEQVTQILLQQNIDIKGKDNLFYARLMSEIDTIAHLYREIYGAHHNGNHSFEEISLFDELPWSADKFRLVFTK